MQAPTSRTVLIGFEASGVMRDAFMARGIPAISCDLKPSARPGPHIRGNVFDHLGRGWLAAILHPPCDFLTVAAEWAFGDGPYHQQVKPGTLVGQARRDARAAAIADFQRCLDAPIRHIAVENPVNCIGGYDQRVQPNWFGDDASKWTCFWLRNLPKLRPTGYRHGRIVDPDPQHLFGGGVERWANQTDSGQNRLSPSPDRAALRAETYPGIAAAAAKQWGDFIMGCG